ncbi:hypothetical protein GF323_01585 [Candidatus Woesearchaeota archaeon]|nr:hypothetical protein [Candidatus Woesearchaeota archaeon]
MYRPEKIISETRQELSSMIDASDIEKSTNLLNDYISGLQTSLKKSIEPDNSSTYRQIMDNEAVSDNIYRLIAAAETKADINSESDPYKVYESLEDSEDVVSKISLRALLELKGLQKNDLSCHVQNIDAKNPSQDDLDNLICYRLVSCEQMAVLDMLQDLGHDIMKYQLSVAGDIAEADSKINAFYNAFYNDSPKHLTDEQKSLLDMANREAKKLAGLDDEEGVAKEDIPLQGNPQTRKIAEQFAGNKKYCNPKTPAAQKRLTVIKRLGPDLLLEYILV